MNKIICFLLAIMMIIGCFTACGFESSSKEDIVIRDANEVVNTTSTAIPSNPIVQVGQTVTLKDLDVTYLEYISNFTTDKYFPANEGYRVIALSFDFANNSSEDRFFWFTCYANDYEMEDYMFAENAVNMTSVNAGRRAAGWVYFQVPVDATDIEV